MNEIFLGFHTSKLDRVAVVLWKKYFQDADLVYFDDYTIKDPASWAVLPAKFRYRLKNPPPKYYELEGFAVFWNEEKRILKFCSKTYSRMEKIKKILV